MAMDTNFGQFSLSLRISIVLASHNGAIRWRSFLWIMMGTYNKSKIKALDKVDQLDKGACDTSPSPIMMMHNTRDIGFRKKLLITYKRHSTIKEEDIKTQAYPFGQH
jgi:hypothetical protein